MARKCAGTLVMRKMLDSRANPQQLQAKRRCNFQEIGFFGATNSRQQAKESGGGDSERKNSRHRDSDALRHRQAAANHFAIATCDVEPGDLPFFPFILPKLPEGPGAPRDPIHMLTAKRSDHSLPLRRRARITLLAPRYRRQSRGRVCHIWGPRSRAHQCSPDS